MTIQRFPAGLQEWLGTKSFGVNPDELGKQISLGLDISQLYGLAEIRDVVAAAATAVGGGVPITVPQTQWWLLYAASASVELDPAATGTGVSLRITHNLNTPEPVGLAFGSAGQIGAPGAVDVPLANWAPSYPMLLPPGTTLLAVMDILGTIASADLTLRARVGILS